MSIDFTPPVVTVEMLEEDIYPSVVVMDPLWSVVSDLKKGRVHVVQYHGTYKGAHGIAVLTKVTGLNDRFVAISKKGVLLDVRRESFSLSLDTTVRHNMITAIGFNVREFGLNMEDAIQYAVRDANAVGWWSNCPLMTDKCWKCGEVVDTNDIEGFSISRVNGDSKYGYEPCHTYCDINMCEGHDGPPCTI